MIADDEVAEAPLDSVVDRPVRDGAAPDARPRRTAAPGDAVGLWHDIRVSVTALRLLIEGMADGVIELDSDSPYLDRTKTHVTFLCELLKELPDRLAPVPAQFGPAMRPTDLGILLERWSHAMHEAACAKELEIRVSVQYDLPPVTCRPDQISRVILNLVDNAIRHSPRKGIVALRALAQPGGVQVQVNDAGPGFRAPLSEHILESARPSGDAGDTSPALGLAIARLIIEAHGGRLWISSPPRGASVRFSLPHREL